MSAWARRSYRSSVSTETRRVLYDTSSCPAVQRGFATTSVASKKVEKPKEEPEPEPDPKNSAEPAADGAATAAVVDSKTKEDWEDEKGAEELALQELVERLHEKGEKEVSRILKVCLKTIQSQLLEPALTLSQAIEFDERLASSFPKLEINQDIRDRVLQLALEEDTASDECESAIWRIDWSPDVQPRPRRASQPRHRQRKRTRLC